MTQTAMNFQLSPAVSAAVAQALQMSKCGGSPMLVVRTKQHGVCIYNKHQLRAVKNEVVEHIFCTTHGFVGQTADSR